MRRSVVVAAVLVALAFALIGGPGLLSSPTTSDLVPDNETDHELFRPTGGESGFWPYLNSRKAFEGRSPINVVVVGETEQVVRLLSESRDADWQETDEELEEVGAGAHAAVAGNGTGGNRTENIETDSIDEREIEVGATNISWALTTGATRYAYVDPGDGGYWVTETAQLHDGTYYGHRYHVRMYESPNPDEPWVAMQTHSEHFDWFTLRHRVHGSQLAQIRLERDLMNLPQVDTREDVSRINLENGNASDADGWATFVDLVGVALAGVVVGLTPTGSLGRVTRAIDARLTEADRRRMDAVRQRVEIRHLILAATIVGIVLGVRLGGIALERADVLSMHAIAATLYPFVAVGLPAGAYLIASGLEQQLDAAIVASGALAVAFWFDYGLLGVSSLPIDVVVVRMLVVVAIGLVAAGAAHQATRDSRWNVMLVAGVSLWILVMGGTLFGYV